MASNLRVDSIVPSTSANVSIGTATGGVTIPGDLGIAGVLTYEDVTNVDSVGVITARSGINISSGSLTIPDSIIHSGDTNTKIRFPEADAVTIETNGSERLRINSAGSWGIGSNFGTSGQVLTSQGNSSAPTWANAGGITHARGYRLNSTADASTGTGSVDLTSWAYEDNSSFSGFLGSGWSLPSSGVFTFPTTGIYDVSMMGMMRQLNDSNAWCGVQGKVTTDNSNYNVAFECYQQIVQASGSSNQYVNFYGHCLIDVTNTSNVKFRVSFFADQDEQVYLHGGGSYNQTALKFIRLGDT